MHLHLVTADSREVKSDIQFVKHFKGLIGGAEGALNQSLNGDLDEALNFLEKNNESHKLVEVYIEQNIGSKHLLILNLGGIGEFNVFHLQRAIINATNEVLEKGFTTLATPVMGISSEVGLPIEQAYRTLLQAILATVKDNIRRNNKIPELTKLTIFDFQEDKVQYFERLTNDILLDIGIRARSLGKREYDLDISGNNISRKRTHNTQRPYTLYDSHYITSNAISTIKILFLASHPKDTQRNRLDEEIREIESAFRQSLFRNQFDIRQHLAVTIMDLQSHFLRHQPNIVHFSGLGQVDGGIILENIQGQSEIISPQALSKLFSVLKDEIKCVVLNISHSESQALAIGEYIDCVIGMTAEIDEKASIRFASAFYQAIGYGRDVKTAFELGCVQIDLENLTSGNIPILIAKNVDPSTIIFAQKDL